MAIWARRVTIAARKGRYDAIRIGMMTSTGDSSSRQELTSELAALDRQLRDLSEQWETVERSITEKTRRRRELIAQQEETNQDHGESWVFSVDTHDAVRVEPNHPDAPRWAQLQRANQRLKEQIEHAWAASGLLTFDALLRRDLDKV